ncbi:MAG: helix-turn-helix domain-containing protein [Erysipelotrichaceae bacterium]|nr:helix-turn-helix domain-containing protein [Erysipelotrichaceae bacterium]
MKYSKEFKLECIRKRKEGIYIATPPGFRERDCFLNQVRDWTRIYDSLGEAGLEHGRPTLDIDQRLELIRRVENGESYKSAALSAGIGDDLLIKWHKIYMEKGIDGLKSLKRGKPSMKKKPVSKEDSDKTKEELLKELEYVRAENEYLKKLSALVQERKAREQKKK